MLTRSAARPLARLARRPAVAAAATAHFSTTPAARLPWQTPVARPLLLAHSARTTLTNPTTPAARRFLSDKTREAIDRAVASAPVVLFMKGTPELPQCGFSRAAIQILGLQGVDPSKFSAFNVLEDPELRAGIKEYSDWPTIPQLYVDGDFVGGCDILISMHQGGDLAKLFEEKHVLFSPTEEEGQAEDKAEEKKA